MTASEQRTTLWPPSLLGVLAALVLLGGVAFAVAVARESALRAWQIYLVNYLFWTGLAVGGVVLAAIWHVTHSVWGKAFQGVAVAGAGFFPASLVLFVPLILAGGTLFPWVSGPRGHRDWWLDPKFVFTRDALSLLVLFVLASVFVYFRIRPVVGARWEQVYGRAGDSTQLPALLRGWQGLAAEQARSERMLTRLAPVLFIVYALVFTLLAFDLVQALNPHWYSTLFGGYFFFGSVYAGLAWLAVLSVFLFRAAPPGVLAPAHLHPLGKLLFGFAMFHGMLFYSQYLPIWYGNLPEETEFIIVRSHEGWWPVVSWAFLLASLLLPFCILLSRAVKEHPRSLLGVSVLVLTGMWLDRFVLVVPSLWRGPEIPFGWLEAAITAGFAALLLLCYWAFSRFVPLLHYDPAHLPSRH